MCIYRRRTVSNATNGFGIGLDRDERSTRARADEEFTGSSANDLYRRNPCIFARQNRPVSSAYMCIYRRRTVSNATNGFGIGLDRDERSTRARADEEFTGSSANDLYRRNPCIFARQNRPVSSAYIRIRTLMAKKAKNAEGPLGPEVLTHVRQKRLKMLKDRWVLLRLPTLCGQVFLLALLRKRMVVGKSKQYAIAYIKTMLVTTIKPLALLRKRMVVGKSKQYAIAYIKTMLVTTIKPQEARIKTRKIGSTK
ncbi:hypothetical protein QE152_g25954 [Popillia japonica]|uniref:Uncharacterized protein n=1 Tax=Popillia japonica TaxID=7064 RepID=A0AAW1K016_POPJA